MRVIAVKRIRAYVLKHPAAATGLHRWLAVAREARWSSLADVRAAFPHADPVTVVSGRTVTVFNIAGNNFRLITAIHYNTGVVYVLRFLAHAEYDKAHWKDEL